jgi:hypothetical protein
MAIGDIVTDEELTAAEPSPAATPQQLQSALSSAVNGSPASTFSQFAAANPSQVFTDADLDAMDAQASAMDGINKAYSASFSNSDPLRLAKTQAELGSSPAFQYSIGIPGAGPIKNTFSSEELDAQLADSLDDPNIILPKDQFFEAKDAATRLGRDSASYQAPKMLGGLLQTAYGAAKELRDNVGMEAMLGGPGAVVRKIFPSAYEGILRKGPVGSVGFWSGVQNSLNNSLNAKQHQIDAANELTASGALTGSLEDQQKLIDARASQLAATAGDGPEDVKLRDWQNYAFHKGVDQELINPEMTKLPGQDFLPKPMPNMSDVASMFSPTPENLAMIAAGEVGGPLLGTAVKATAGKALTAIATGGIKVDQALIDASAAMGRKIEDVTGYAPETLKKAGDFVAGAGGASALGGIVGAVDPNYSKAAAEAAIAYGLLRKGAAIIRVGSKAAGTAGVFFREAADPMGPLRAESIAAMAADPSIPEAYRVGMLSTASAIDSTPKRIAANPDLPESTRKLAQTLSSPALVASVRGLGTMAEGATAGALAMTPLMLTSQNDGKAGSLALTGAAMGAAGRTLGLVGSRARQINADIGRFLVDTHLSGGNVERTASLPRQRLEQMASFQGMLSSKGVNLIPLSGQEYSANIMALGGTPGSAGFHVEIPTDGGAPRILVNLDAKVSSEGHEFAHAVAASNVLGGRIRADIFNWVNQSYGTDGVLARGREYVKRLIESEDRAYEERYHPNKAPIRSLPDMESRISMRVDELGQQSLKEGNHDPLDWARNEIWAEQLSNGGIDLNKIRRGVPLGIEPSAIGESILGGTARVLKTLGVAIDDQTGKVQSSLSAIFKDNPLIGNSPKLRKTLANYVDAYDRWLPGVVEESNKAAPGIRVAASGNIADFINSPLIRLHETSPGIRENEFMIEENGVSRFKTQAEINSDAKTKESQVGMLYTHGRLLPRDSTEFGPRKIDGRIVVGGPVLPAQFDGLSHFSPYLRQSARGMEANRAPGGPGSSFSIVYHRIGTSESGTFKVINRGNTEAVVREVVPFGWRVSNAKKILANVLDMTALRGSVMKAMNEGKMGIFNHDMDQFGADLKTYFDNHSKGLAGENRIGMAKKNAIDSFLFAGATKANRAANPVYGDFGTRGTIRTLRLDRIQSIEPTGRTGLHFDYDKSNYNLMPDVVDRPVGQAMADVSESENGFPLQLEYGRDVGRMRQTKGGNWQVVGSSGKPTTYSNYAKAIKRSDYEVNMSKSINELKPLYDPADRKALTVAQQRIAEVSRNNPEAIRLEIARDKDTGLPKIAKLYDADDEPILDDKGRHMRGVIFTKEKYALRNAPGLSKDDSTAIRQGADALVAHTQQAIQDPTIAAGVGWYGRMRTFLQKAFGANIELFGQLLGATSARTPVDINFRQALEAIRLFSRGHYDDLLERFAQHINEVHAKANSGELLSNWLAKSSKNKESAFDLQDEVRKQINTFKEVPLREAGAKYNANSQKVLHALYGNWIEQTVGPKTPNFAGNLTGRTLKATIDVWAARNLRRLLYENKVKRWRILPEQEQAVSSSYNKAGEMTGDFPFAQKIYEEAANRLGMNPDDLQALIWFAEKDVWEKNGWTNTVGAEKSSFDKEAGKLDMDRYQVGITTFTTKNQYDQAVQNQERLKLRAAASQIKGLQASRITHSDGFYGGKPEPAIDAELSVQRNSDGTSPSIAPFVNQIIKTAKEQKQQDAFVSLVVDSNHPNARPMIEIGFKSPGAKDELNAIMERFQKSGIDGFTVSKDDHGKVLGIRSQYIPEFSAGEDHGSVHLDPSKYVINCDQWMDKARSVLESLSDIDNISYRQESHVSTTVYGKHEYNTASPRDLRTTSAAEELGRRKRLLSSGS